jgi:hypothetical protein
MKSLLCDAFFSPSFAAFGSSLAGSSKFFGAWKKHFFQVKKNSIAKKRQ